METTQHIPADVRERIRDAIREGVRYVAKADGAYLYEPSVDETVDRILALLRAPRGEGEASGLAECIITCMGCGQDFDADDDVQARYHEAACEVVDYEPARVEIARRLRGAALRSDAQGEDRWEDVVFGPITEAYNEAHAARRSDAQEKEDALVCASCGEPIGDEPTVIWQDAYTHYRCTPEDAIRDDTPVIRPIDAARRGEGGGE